ncbi:glycosyltransferase family 2 protein [Legionella fallonii]|uniref:GLYCOSYLTRANSFERASE RELATED n=1 Tax=Legionella fallonii LLAP-10 TaxID=1212491 RepID=A0A098GAE2_9GAMM|nr:glycosyltransferase family 2 protein [Legionella fallonii]CEG58990.1 GLYCOSYLTRANSFERASE RELATED [Legionella fallonii LLAP-10]
MAITQFSIVIPVYKNEKSIPRLIEELSKLNIALNNQIEAIFVIDGSPDQSYELLRNALNNLSFNAKLLIHSRNFGSFAAIRSGLQAANGKYFGIMAADLQEPPELLINFFQALSSDECDVAIGIRTSRNDPLLSRLFSKIFWDMYRRFIVKDMPAGGVDIFGCNHIFREQLLKLDESRSSLIALVFWLGFRRKFIPYERLARESGKSSWSLRKKMDYMMDSIFAFTDLPIRLLIRTGMIGCFISIILGGVVFISSIAGNITVSGYAATMLTLLFFGTINLLAIGLVGTYSWRGYENSKKRPLAIVSLVHENNREDRE